MIAAIRFLVRNLGTLIIALLLALLVWISAVTAADPNQQLEYPQAIPIEQVGKNPKLLIVGTVPESERVTLNAPRSIQEQLASDPTSIRAWIDLTNLGAGTHTVPVQVKPNLGPVRVVRQVPAEVHIVLEPLTTKTMTVTLTVQGQAALGYKAGSPTYTPTQVAVSGPA